MQLGVTIDLWQVESKPLHTVNSFFFFFNQMGQLEKVFT